MGQYDARVRHSWIDVGGIRTFYREAGPPGAPVVLLPHGFPCSSYAYRNLLPKLGDQWRLLAPDAPGFGYSDTPGLERFEYTFAAYAHWLEGFTRAMQLERYAIYLHDYGSQFGFELARRAPNRVAALVIQNGDIYEDQHGPKYAQLKEYWRHPTSEGRAAIAANVSEQGFRDEFVGEVDDHLVDLVPPDLWTLHWSLMNTPARRENVVRLIADQASTLPRFALQQEYLSIHRPPTLILWGVQDGYMPEGAARAYLRDLPDAELHLFEAGHWLLETHLDEAVDLMRDFFIRTLTAG